MGNGIWEAKVRGDRMARGFLILSIIAAIWGVAAAPPPPVGIRVECFNRSTGAIFYVSAIPTGKTILWKTAKYQHTFLITECTFTFPE